jgi:hypothetical protein
MVLEAKATLASMNRLLITIPFHTDNAPQAERLLDFIYQMNKRKTHSTHVLLAYHADVHKELRDKIGISAELAFSGIHWLEVRKLIDERVPKFAHISNAFQQVATHIPQLFTWPWLWLEPDCTPHSPDWLEELSEGYSQQPKRYFGLHLKRLAGDGKTVAGMLMARVGVYPHNAIQDMGKPDVTQNLVEHRFAMEFYPRSTGTKLFQQLTVKEREDLQRIRDGAVLVHGDKVGLVADEALARQMKNRPKAKPREVANV